MNPVSLHNLRGAARTLGAAALSAILIAGIGFETSSAAEGSATAPHDAMAQEMSRHVQSHLDRLGERLEIKASQEDSWQTFSAAFRDAMTRRMGEHAAAKTDEDAAALVRAHAERAADHAQKLARLADATTKLEQALNPQQRQVFNEVARHFAEEHEGHHAMWHEGHGEREGAHCDRPRDGHWREHSEHDDGMHGDAHADASGNGAMGAETTVH